MPFVSRKRRVSYRPMALYSKNATAVCKKKNSAKTKVQKRFNGVEHVRNLLEELNHNGKKTYVQFVRTVRPNDATKFEKKVYKTLLQYDGASNAYVIDENDVPCIQIINFKSSVHLEDYHYMHQGNCNPILTHEDFFILLDAIAFIHNKNLNLNDGSTKTINDCKFSHRFLKLAKGKTFYNRYGFHQEHFDTIMEKVGRTKVSAMGLNLKALFGQRENPPDNTYIYDSARALFPMINNETTVSELAKIMLEKIPANCYENSEYAYAYSSLISQIEVDIRSRNEFMGIFHKDKKTKETFPSMYYVKTGVEKPAYIVTFLYNKA